MCNRDCFRNCCNRRCCGGCCNNYWRPGWGCGCNDFMSPLMFILLRDTIRSSRCCGWVDRYDQYRC